MRNSRRLRQQASPPLYMTQLTRIDQTLFPDSKNFLQLDSVRPHWAVDARQRTVIDNEAWELALPDIKAEIEDFKHFSRVKHLHKLPKVLCRARVPLADLDELVKRSTLPQSWRDCETDITAEEMDPVLSLYVAQPLCTHARCYSTHSLFDIFHHEDLKHSGSSSALILSYKWAKVVREMAEETGLDVLEVKEEDLESLGPVFECTDCA